MAWAASGATQQFDPKARGDIRRSNAAARSPGASATYRLYVPKTWKPGEHLPLVVILHGGAGTPDTVFDRAPPRLHGVIQRLAEAHRFIVVAPSAGNRGAYGDPYKMPRGQGAPPGPGVAAIPAGGDTPPRPLPSDSGSADELARYRALSEADVMEVVDRTSAEYRVDRRRIYLMGNSMGGMGTYYLAAARPGKWCAISPSDGPVDDGQYPFRAIRYLSGAMIVHGDADTLAPIAASRAMAEGFRGQGVDTRFVVVRGGTHPDSWYRNLSRAFAFFEAHRCEGGRSDSRRQQPPRR